MPKLTARHDMAQLCYGYSDPQTHQPTFLALPRFEGSTPVMFTPSLRVKVDNPERFGPYDPKNFRQWAVNFSEASERTETKS